MDRNLRRHPRLDIEYPAAVQCENRCYTDCRIINFSQGGLFLQSKYAFSFEQMEQGFYRGNPRPQALIKLKESSFSVKVEIAYVTQAGLGVAFLGPEPQLFAYLRDYQQRIVESTGAAVSEWATSGLATKSIIERLRVKTVNYLEKYFTGFIGMASEDLISTNEQTLSGSAQADLFFAINTLEKHEAQIHDAFIASVESSLFKLMEGEAVAVRQVNTPATELVLVDKNEFDEWILLNGIAHKLETEITGPVYKLNVFFTHLFKRPIKGEANPLIPISLLLRIQEAIDEYQLAPDALRIIFQAFSKAVLSNLNRLYGELVACLKEEGIGPELPAFLDQTDAVTTGGRTETLKQPRQTLENLSCMLGVNRGEDSAETESPPPYPVATKEQVFDSIESMPLRPGPTILRQLENHLSQPGEDPLSLDPTTRAAIGTSEEVVAAVQQDDLLSTNVHELVRRFEIPFIKETISDPAMLENAKHPGRRFLEAVEGLAPYVTNRAGNRSSGRDIPRVLEQIISNIDQGSLTDIVEATAQIEELQDQQKEQFERNRNIAIESCKRNEKLRKAHAFVRTSLQEMLLNKSVSIAVDRLFLYGWSGLLIHTVMLKEQTSKEWNAYLRVIEILAKLFRAEARFSALPQKNAEDLLRIIRKGFTDYPVHPEGAQSFTEELQTALLEGGEAAQNLQNNRVTFDEDYLQTLFLGQSFFESESTDMLEVEEKWLELVAGIELGEWIVERREEGQVRLVNMAWRSPETGRNLLLDGNGIKILETDSKGFAAKFQSNRYALLEDKELQMVDRAVHRIMQDTYNTIEHQVSYDELTGLMNRRAFERLLNELLTGGGKDGDTHSLIMLDVDKFGLVNDICGFDGGDKLLQSITNILSTYLPENAHLARTGDDEFAVLMPQSSIDRGYQVAETHRQAIDEFRYSWNNQLIPVSASVGIVAVNDTSMTSVELLKAASSACSIAKQAGRNCTRIYRSTDQAFVEHKQLIKTVAGIEHALENNRLQLMAQLIEPLQDEGESSHYEILLRVMGKDDELQSPFQFIKAAEQYDLMRAVDRWVVNRFFEVVHDNMDQIEAIGGFSINLSSQTIADNEFKDYLKEQIESSSIPNEKLGFEITETAMLKDAHDAISFIEEIREMGCGFYLDDFGSGYASFSYLKDLPVDYVKIDGIFIKDMRTDHASKAMVTSITDIAHFMGRKVVAEFVEDAETAEALKTIGVDYIQGYHIGRPGPLEDLFFSKNDTGVIENAGRMPVVSDIPSPS